VRDIEENVGDTTSTPTTRLLLEWEAATMPRLFPLMKGELSVYPLTSTETQLDFSGMYEAPFGAVGKTMNLGPGVTQPRPDPLNSKKYRALGPY
jgi:hypothetical protein